MFGEIHNDPDASQFIANTISTLKKSGTTLNGLALEVPIDAQESFLKAVDDPARLPGDSYEFNSNGNRIAGLGGFISLARHCRSLGMDIHCVDAPRRPNNGEVRDIQKLDEKYLRGRLSEEGYVRKNQKLHQKRNRFMADKISSIGGGVAVVVGMFHTGGPGSIEEHLRKRDMSVASMDVYPRAPRDAVIDIFARNEHPSVDIKAISSHGSPTTAQVGALISNLRGRGTQDPEQPARRLAENFSVGPLRRGMQVPSQEQHSSPRGLTY